MKYLKMITACLSFNLIFLLAIQLNADQRTPFRFHSQDAYRYTVKPVDYGLNFGTGTASTGSGSQIILNDFSYFGNSYNASLKLYADGTWGLASEDDNDEGSFIDLGSASVAVMGPNTLRLYDLEYNEERFDAVLSMHLDGGWNLERLGFTAERDERKIGAGPVDLYPGGYLNGVRASVEQVITSGNFAYAVVRDGDGEQRIDAWDISDITAPVLVDQRSYGNYFTTPSDYDLLPNIAAVNGKILVQSSLNTEVLRASGDGSLMEEDMEEGYGLSIPTYQNVNFGGGFAVVMDTDYSKYFVNVKNPSRPFKITGGVSAPGDSITGTYKDEPAELTVNGVQSARLSVYQTDMDAHLDGFWEDKLSLLFPGASLDRPIGALITEAVNSIDLSAKLQTLYSALPDQLDLSADLTVSEALSASYDGDMTVKQLLLNLDLDGYEDFEQGLRRMIRSKINADTGDLAARLILKPLWEEWLGNTLGLDIGLSDIDSFSEQFSAALDADLDASSLSAYLAEKMVGPLLGDPPYITETLDVLVRGVADNAAADIISGFLSVARAVTDPGGAVEWVLEWDAISAVAPNCLIPETALELLEMVLYDHLNLNPDGLALIEMLKMYQYFNGNTDYLDYTADLDAYIRSLHANLAEALTAALNPALDALRFTGSIQDRLEDFSAQLPAADIIVDGITEVVLARLEAEGISCSRNMREVLMDLGIYIEETDLPDGRLGLTTITEVQEILTNNLTMEYLDSFGTVVELPFAELPLGELFNLSRQQVIGARKILSGMLIKAVQRDFGVFELDMTLKGALKTYLDRRIDLSGTFMAGINGIFGAIGKKSYNMSIGADDLPFINLLDLARQFQDGDCIAGWQLYLEAASDVALALTLVDGSATSTTLRVAEASLAKAKEKAVEYFINRLILELSMYVFGELNGSFDNVLSKVVQNDYDIDLADITSLNPSRVEGELLGDRVGFVFIENRNSSGFRNAALSVVHTLNPVESTETDLGSWDQVDYVHATDGVIMVGGIRVNDNGSLKPTAAFIDTRADTPGTTYYTSSEISSAEAFTISDDGLNVVLSGPWGAKILPLSIK